MNFMVVGWRVRMCVTIRNTIQQTKKDEERLIESSEPGMLCGGDAH